jgi:hypothetical protein
MFIHCLAVDHSCAMLFLFYLLQLLRLASSFSRIYAPTHRSTRRAPQSTPFFTVNSRHVSMPSYPPQRSSTATTALSLHGGLDSDLSQSLLSPSSSILLCEEASWRQYVSVVVIGLVLIDILLGSPFAKSLLNKARPENMSDEVDGNNRPSALGSSRESTPNPARGSYSRKPRIDVDGYAKAALERAEGVAQLREYLDAQKTDWDRMEDMKRQMDQKMQELDRKNRNEEAP